MRDCFGGLFLLTLDTIPKSVYVLFIVFVFSDLNILRYFIFET